MDIGDKLVAKTGDVKDAAIQMREYRLRTREDLVGNLEKIKHFPTQTVPRLARNS